MTATQMTATQTRRYEIYAVGPLTVVGFPAGIADDCKLAGARDDILFMVLENGCDTIAFDLTGVTIMPSGLVGLLLTLRDHGIAIHLYNVSEDIREVLQLTKLDRLVQIHQVAV